MKTILCYGDSNTYGCRPLDFDTLKGDYVASDYRWGKEYRWTGVLARKLGIGYKVIEEGLNGRTTVFDDPVEGSHKNGSAFLRACLESHAPIGYVLLMLGTNDLKKRFSASAFDIALGINVLIDIIMSSQSGPAGSCPQILLMCPPPIGKLTHFSESFEGAGPKSERLSIYFEKIAKNKGCHYMDVGKIIRPSELDGLHYDRQSHALLGEAVYNYIKKEYA